MLFVLSPMFLTAKLMVTTDRYISKHRKEVWLTEWETLNHLRLYKGTSEALGKSELKEQYINFDFST